MELLSEIRQIIKEEFGNFKEEKQRVQFISVDEARNLFNPKITRGTIYNWMNAKHIKSYKVVGRIYFKYGEFIEDVQKVNSKLANNLIK